MAAAGIIGGNGSSSSSSWFKLRDRQKNKKMVNRVVFCSASSSSVMDHYKTLRIQPGASESEVKKAFRQLALQVSLIFMFFNNLENCLFFVKLFYPGIS
jgi:hypothetical protein